MQRFYNISDLEMYRYFRYNENIFYIGGCGNIMYEKLNEAIVFATECHAGQVRKLAHTPYILHPLEVAAIISTMTSDEDIMIAGLLHDTIEDCDVDPLLITKKFGIRASALVQSESEDRYSKRPASETWIQRKADSLLMLQHTKEFDVKILWLADKLSNMRSFAREYRKHGDEIWKSLNQKDPKMHAWYYWTIAKYLRGELGDTAAFLEYERLVEYVFGKEEETLPHSGSKENQSL